MAPYNPPLITNYAHIKVNNSNISKIMGENGKWFKSFTEKNKLKYVWYNKENKYIELWGTHFSIENATPILKNRINKFNY